MLPTTRSNAWLLAAWKIGVHGVLFLVTNVVSIKVIHFETRQPRWSLLHATGEERIPIYLMMKVSELSTTHSGLISLTPTSSPALLQTFFINSTRASSRIT